MEDHEINTMAAITEMFMNHDADTRRRIINWMMQRYYYTPSVIINADTNSLFCGGTVIGTDDPTPPAS